jgi:two-component system, NtrC family, response regulator GlrR
VLTDDTVSRRHCELESGERGVRITDAGSTNGILANNVKIKDATVTAPTSLQLGDTTLSISPTTDVVAREELITDSFCDMVGGSPKMRELFASLFRISATDLSVLIEGETGTGKELVAESIHQTSQRASSPLVVFDCSSVVVSLAESELFGHERGAFTGAVAPRIGVFEQANGGTIFLDELGELPKDLQPKLLRVLEKRELRRVGGTKTIPIDVRVIAATNRNMREAVKRGDFREDLYYRIAGSHVYVPPLRDRMDDLPLLAQHFLSAAAPPRDISEVPRHIWEMFCSYRWPGNVRELRNAVKRVLVTPECPLDPDAECLYEPPVFRSVPTSGSITPFRVARRETNDSFEKSYVQALLKRCDGNITRAAALAEISRQVIYALISKHAL